MRCYSADIALCVRQKRTCINRSLFCGKLKSLAVGRKVVNKIAEKLRGKLSLWHCNYLPIREKGIGKIKICNLMMTFFPLPAANDY